MAPPTGSMALTPEQYTLPKVFFSINLSVDGKTAIITGGNQGLGLESARILLSLGLSRLILAVRTIYKGEEAAESLRKQYPRAKIEVERLDMNSYESIRAFAQKASALDRLDIAILSAGIMNTEQVINPTTGHEEQFQVNYLSTALLGILLLPVLKNKGSPSGGAGRLMLVASGAALIAEFSERNQPRLLPAFDKTDEWSSTMAKKRYDTSKGLVLMLTLLLSRLTVADKVIVNVVDPSFTPGTSFFRQLPFLMRVVLWPLTTLLGTSVNNAGWRYIDGAVARGKESHGSLVSDWVLHPYHPFMYTVEGERYMDRLWDETLQELDFPDVRAALGALSS